MFLQILGGIFLALLLVLGFYGWKFYRFIKRQANSDFGRAIAAFPPQELDLEASNADDWQETERLAFAERELKKIGAKHIGYYTVYIASGVIRLSLWQYKQQALTAIYEAVADIDQKHPQFFYEVACQFEKGSLCISSNSNATLSSRPEEHQIIFNESNSLIDFFKALQASIPKGKKIVPIIEPIEFFRENYEDICEWAWRAEQIKSSRQQQTLQSMGITVTDELLEQLIDMGRAYAVEVHTERVKKRLAKHGKMNAEQWERIRDRLVIVNERMDKNDLICALYELGGELTEAQEQALDGFEKNSEKLIDPIGAFQMMMQSLNIRAKRVTQVSEPVKSEVYLPL